MDGKPGAGSRKTASGDGRKRSRPASEGIDEAILEALAATRSPTEQESGGVYLSGEALSHALNISRTAVWKHIRGLQKKGYRIQGASSKGYTLVAGPDLLSRTEIRKRLRTRVLGLSLNLLESVGSTNDQAMVMGEEGEPEGAVFLAETQTRGRGRMGRSWISPPGMNLYLSVLFRPRFSPRQAPIMTFLAAVAVVESMAGLTGVDAWIKWPNDVLIEGRKVAGILTEMHAEQDTIHHLVVGVGMNVNMPLETLPPPLRETATSLLDVLGRKSDRVALLCRFLESLEEGYDLLNREGAAPILERWERWSRIRGERVRVVTPKERIEGVAEGVTSEGALSVRLSDGEWREIYAGDVEIVKTR